MPAASSPTCSARHKLDSFSLIRYTEISVPNGSEGKAMITYVVGDLFTSPAKVLVNTVNTVGVMGKGIAYDFKRIYPEMFEEYQKLCKQKKFNVGQLWLYKTPHKWILNFPTKKHWRGKSKMEYIEAGLQKFVDTYDSKGMLSVSFPMLGCGNGGLDWEKQVQPLMENYLADLPIDIFIHIGTKPCFPNDAIERTRGMASKKPGFQKILAVLDELEQEPWLDEQRKWWPDYLFHFTHIENAVSILNSDFLFSRAEVKRQGINFVDSISPLIRRKANLRDEIRFYFRPHTSTTYQREGFKPLGQRYHQSDDYPQGAHCPVPVYFLFDMRAIITLPDTCFSDGNLTRNDTRLFTTADEFITQLPFEDIYHDTGWSSEPENRHDEIKNRRQAEVIYPKKISLDYLKYICCRSQAEYETLRHLLSPNDWKKWESKVRVPNDPHLLFKKEWLHIEYVKLTKKSINIHFNLPDECRYYGPFKIRINIDLWAYFRYYHEKVFEDIVAELDNARFNLDLPNINITNYIVKVFIDDNLAYSGVYNNRL